MTTQAPITVDDLMQQVDRRSDDVYRLTLLQMLEQFAAEQRAQGAAELLEENARLDAALTQALDERDLAQDALLEASMAMDGPEWCGKLPPEEPPNSGDLHLDVPELCKQLRAELAATKQRIEAAEVDAARYRWLRDQHRKHLGLTICKVGMFDLTPWSGDDPDTAIDAAIAAQEKGE